MAKRMVLNLFGEWVPEEEPAAPAKPMEQGTLFDNDVPPDLARERKLAEQHRQEGGKELFPEEPE